MNRFTTRTAGMICAALATLVASGAAAQAGEINSGLEIRAGQTFELGGGQDGTFTVTGRNTGPVAVVVYGLPEGARAPVERATIAPGESVDATFRSGETALLRNTSTMETARLKLKINGDTASLGMTYSGNR